MAFGVWCPEKKQWLETLFGQIQEFNSIPEAEVQAAALNGILQKINLDQPYVVRMVSPHGHLVE